MNKSLVFFLMVLATAMVSCTPAVTGNEMISFGTALGVCFSRLSYLIPLVIVTIISGIVVKKAITRYQETQEAGITILLILLALVAFAFALLFAPAEIAANTTKEMFSRGVIINP